MRARIARFLRAEDGPSAVEYAVLLSLIVVGIWNLVAVLGHSVSNTVGSINAKVSSANAS